MSYREVDSQLYKAFSNCYRHRQVPFCTIKHTAYTSRPYCCYKGPFLQSNNIPYGDNWRKCQLLETGKNHKSEPKYQIDEILKSQSHEVLRLTPYHTLNPIELIWGIIKVKVVSKTSIHLSVI